MRFPKRRTLLKAFIILVILTAPCWMTVSGLFSYRTYKRWFVYTPEDRAHVGEGLPSDARKWSAELGAITDPDQIDPASGIVVKKYGGNEWVIGRESDSHDFFQRGGTIVIKDSRGAVHAYYGHICGAGTLEHNFSKYRYWNLDELYKAIDKRLQGSYESDAFSCPEMVEPMLSPGLR